MNGEIWNIQISSPVYKFPIKCGVSWFNVNIKCGTKYQVFVKFEMFLMMPFQDGMAVATGSWDSFLKIWN